MVTGDDPYSGLDEMSWKNCTAGARVDCSQHGRRLRRAYRAEEELQGFPSFVK